VLPTYNSNLQLPTKKHQMNSLNSIFPESRVRTRLSDRLAYSRDASFYQLTPQAVVFPTSTNEIQSLFGWCNDTKIPVTFRAGGSSLSGQAVGTGIIADISHGFRSIHIIDNGLKVNVGTAIRGGYANTILKKYGRKIGPDPASINTAMIGGILANNSSGMCCGISQNAYHTLDSMTLVLPNGFIINTADTNSNANLNNNHPNILNGLLELQKEIHYSESIKSKIKTKYQIKNTIGYSLNAFLDFTSPVDILQHLLIGSEGTLGFISDVVLNTVPSYQHTYTGLLFFSSIENACNAISPLADSGAVAIELMDYASVSSVTNLPSTPKSLQSLPQNCTTLLVEYQASDIDSLRHYIESSETVNSRLKDTSLSINPTFTQDTNLAQLYWSIRKGLMPTIGAQRKSGTSLINEDIAFKREDLAKGVNDLQTLLHSSGYDNGIIFGHAKDGNMHFIIPKELKTEEQLNKYSAFMDKLADMVVGKYDGSLKAEHGTGRNMAPFVASEWGDDCYSIMVRLKKLLDPNNICNPDVIITNDSKIHVKNIKQLPTIEPEVDKCIECGFCESSCPSRELTLSPRQRIVLRREMKHLKDMGDTQTLSQLTKEFDYSGVDTCAVDGMCSTSCPVGINTGELVKRLRSESHSSTSESIANWCAENFGLVIRTSMTTNSIASKTAQILGSSLVETSSELLHSLVATPQWKEFLGTPLSSSDSNSEVMDVLYFSSCSTRLFGKNKQTSTLFEVFASLCTKAGLKAGQYSKLDSYCCGNVFSSKGYNNALDTAETNLYNYLIKVTNNGRIPVVIDSSSCAYQFITGLNDNHESQLRVFDIITFIHDEVMNKLVIQKSNKHVVVHPVCASVKSSSSKHLIGIASACSSEVFIPPSSGCCGFAGDRGLTHPELTLLATKYQAQEIKSYASEHQLEGCYSCNLTCEYAMSNATGMNYENILSLLDRVSSSYKM
jgi:D-lactate dehydrogenase